MADWPDSTARAPSAGNADDSSPIASAVPAWLAARRARVSSVPSPRRAADDVEIEFASVSETDSSSETAVEASSTQSGVTTPVAETAAQTRRISDSSRTISETRVASGPPPLPARTPKPASLILPVLPAPGLDAGPEHKSFNRRVLCWIRSTVSTGILVSLLLHALLLTILGMLVLGGASSPQGVEIFGVLDGDSDVFSDIDLDTTLGVDDPGKNAAELEFSDSSQLTGDEKTAFDPASAIRGTLDGVGKQGGGGGQGDGLGVPALNVPKYAVTKGSFSVWTVPKDPAPGVAYQIVIQFRLPGSVRTYRGSDLTGMVTGTDGYKQAIRFGRTETFPVENGSVQLRIRVPGADRLVRDVIRIESKLLREKQVVEIEF